MSGSKKRFRFDDIIKYIILITAFFYTMVLCVYKLDPVSINASEKKAIVALICLASLVFLMCIIRNSLSISGWCVWLVLYCILFASQFIFMKLQSAYIPIILPAAIISIMYHPYSGISFHLLFCISLYYLGQAGNTESFIFYFLFGVIVCFVSELMTNVKNILYSFVVIVICYTSLIIIWMEYHNNGINTVKLLSGYIQIAITIAVCFVCIILRKVLSIRRKPSNSRYEQLCNEDFPPIAEMRDNSLRVFYHTLEVADLSAAAAKASGADEMLARTGAMYHDIGKTMSNNYVAAGVVIARENDVPEEVIRIIEEHNGKLRKPGSIEAAIVMLADTIVSTKDYMLRKNARSLEQKKIIDNVMTLRLESGLIDEAGVSIKQYNQIKETFVSIMCGTIEER